MHSWDLATTLGTEVEVPEELVLEIEAFAHLVLDPWDRDEVNFTAPLPATTDTAPLERRVAYSGRKVAGQPAPARRAPPAGSDSRRRGGVRTHTPPEGLGGLSPLRLPVPPPGPDVTVAEPAPVAERRWGSTGRRMVRRPRWMAPPEATSPPVGRAPRPTGPALAGPALAGGAGRPGPTGREPAGGG